MTLTNDAVLEQCRGFLTSMVPVAGGDRVAVDAFAEMVKGVVGQFERGEGRKTK